jgi:uncharacterized protein YjiK
MTARKSSALYLMTMTKRAALAALLLAACAETAPVDAQQAGASGSLFAAQSDTQWRLPNELREISGLALSPDGRLFAHNDERAVIYEIDATRGAIVKAFALGDGALRGDFEGLAISPDGVFWIATSRGELYRFNEGADGATVSFEVLNSGLRDVCEIEGLAYLPAEESLILGCKQNEARDMRSTVSLYSWRFSGSAEPWREVPEREIAAAAGVEDFRPSSLDVDARSGRLLVLSANDAALAELDGEGRLVAAHALRGHPQPEGVAVLQNGALVISDEGGRGQAQLSRYARAP